MAAKRPTAIISLSDRPDYINFLVYGDSGAGKTVLLGSSNGLIVGVEDGTVSAKRQGSSADLWPVGHWSDVQAAHKWLKENPDHGYDWICLDSLTELREICMKAILEEAHANNSNRSLETPAIQDYGLAITRIKGMVAAFNNLPVNVAYSAHIDKPEGFDEEEDEEDLTNPAMPLIPGKKGQLQQYICGMMHVVGYLGVVPASKKPDPDDNEKTIIVPERRILLCRSTRRYFGKDRFDSLPNGRLNNPTIPILEKKIKEAMPGAKTKEEKPAEEQGQAAPKARRR